MPAACPAGPTAHATRSIDSFDGGHPRAARVAAAMFSRKTSVTADRPR
jgi:hypothetical protein